MAYEFMKLNQIPLAEEVSGNAHAIIEDAGEIKRYPLNTGSGEGLVDEVITVTAVMVPDAEEEDEYDWMVETSIPVEEIIAKCQDGKNIALDVTAQFNRSEMSFMMHGLGMCSGVSVQMEEEVAKAIFGFCGGLIVMYMYEEYEGEQYERWMIEMGGM